MAEAASRLDVVKPGNARAKEDAGIVFKRGEVSLLNFKNNDWYAVAPKGIKAPEQLQSDPAMWAAVASDLRPYDLIRVIARDESWWAECLVCDTGIGFAKVALLRTIKLEPRAKNGTSRLPDGYEIVRDLDGYRVRRLRDNVFMGAHLPREEDAVRALLDHASLRIR